jgi:hypothetical protein
MNYDLFLMHKVLIDHGVHVNGVSFESLPYDEQYDIMPELFNEFERHPMNRADVNLYDCLTDYLAIKKFKLYIGIKNTEVMDEIRNFIEYYTSDEQEGIRMFNTLEDYMKEVHNG